MAAVDDVRIVIGTSHPQKNGQVVIIENTNRAKSVKASVDVTADGNRTVSRIGFGDTNVFPRQFEIIVGPGRRRWIGSSKLLQPTLRDTKFINVFYSVVGAAYTSDEPVIPVRSVVAEMFGFYALDNGEADQVTIVGVNLSNEWAITGSVEATPRDTFTFNLPPMTCTLTGHRYKKSPPGGRLVGPTFYEAFPPTLVGQD